MKTAQVVESKEGPKCFTVEVRDARGNEMLAVGFKNHRNAVIAANAINRGLWVVGNVRANNSERQEARRFNATWSGGPVMNPYNCYGSVVLAHEYDALLSQVERMREALKACDAYFKCAGDLETARKFTLAAIKDCP